MALTTENCAAPAEMEHFKNVALYREFSSVQKKDAHFLFKECLEKTRLQLENCEAVLDVGCGTGETFFDFIMPSLKREEGLKVVGVDKSKEMVEFATEKYGSENQSFYVYDIQSGLENIDFIQQESFELVTLSYCYHWVKDEMSLLRLNFLQFIKKYHFRAALFNIHRLLKPGGFCFMIFPVNHIFYKACEVQGKVEKFKPFVNLEDFISRHYYSKNPVAELRSRMEEVGLGIQHLELRKLNFTFPSLKNLAS